MITEQQLWDKWIAALKSGNYKRIAHTLAHDTKHMCCLGVLCDVYDPSKWKKDDHEPFLRYNGKKLHLSAHVKHAANLGEIGFHVESGNYPLALTDINDKSNHPDYRDVLPHIETEYRRRFNKEPTNEA